MNNHNQGLDIIFDKFQKVVNALINNTNMVKLISYRRIEIPNWGEYFEGYI
ncbi:hypothetical protein [Abyssisolibacter fermentans]|uniref:hypothetical protein n=1 Tax=Abyssisolibacter fermentans TaxID=1766203 RepID=UPI0012E34874|nr:hypothetical protein [Abyssisolibacter fermentans]